MDQEVEKELVDKVNQLHTALVGTEQLPGAVPQFKAALDEFKAKLEKQQDQIRRLENWRYYCLGLAAAVAYGVKLITSYFGAKQ